MSLLRVLVEELGIDNEEKPKLKRGFFDAPKPKTKASTGSKSSDEVITLKGKKDRIAGSTKAIPGRRGSSHAMKVTAPGQRQSNIT